MSDVLTPSQRSFNMSRIRGKDTKPEMIVRRMVHGMGYRYCLHRKALPGCPDLVFPARRKVIFVHGCYWHRHACKLGRPLPATRKAFWRAKLDGNRRRDQRNVRKLRANGWKVLIVWECQTKRNLSLLENRILNFLG